jgi:TatD DNase family protein
MSLLIDSHVNLHHEAFAEDREAVIDRARAVGVARMITICDKAENFPAVIAIAEAHADIYASAGAHPHYAKDHRELTAARLIEMGAHPKVVGIGETGLDLHYTFSPLDDQVAVFRAHAAAARTLGLPLIIHTREADDRMAALLEEEAGKGLRAILLHCYTSGPELARRALKLGAYFSFSGIMTFKNAHDVRAVAAEIPLDRIIVETDCPYLAPVPHRGRRCEPAHVADVQAALLALRGLEAEEGSALLADNFHRLFPKIPRA